MRRRFRLGEIPHHALLSIGEFSIGSLNLSRTTVTTPAIGPLPASKTQSDTGSAGFVKYDASSFSSSLGLLQQASFGSCIVTTIQAGKGSTTIPRFTALDAGPVINLTGGATGPKTLQKQQGAAGFYFAALGGGNAGPNYIQDAGGTFRFDNGAGGVDVKSFGSVALTLAAPLVWTNMDQVPENIPRSQDLLITWSGGDPNSYVTISGASILQNPTLVTTFSLSVFNNGNRVKFTAPGIDFGYATWSGSAGKPVNCQ